MTQAKKQDDIRLNLASHDAVGERIEQLKALLPEVFVEGQLDPERLRQHLGDFSKVGAERFGLNWAGKSEAIRSLQIPSHGTLVPLKDQSVNFDESENMIIEGDNLEVLKLLQKSYHGKIKMIYIDPPYNTGGDFIYPDNFKEGLDTYLRYSGQATEQGFKVSTNSENGGRYHSNWLNMMYPRLFMAKNLLRDDGVICVSIDDHEVNNLVLIMNEIFGEECFITKFIWKSRQIVDSRPKNNVSNDHEYIVVYSRMPDSKVRGKEIDQSKYSNPDNDPRGPWMSNSILGLATKSQRPNLHYKITDPATKLSFDCPPDSGWRYSRDTMDQKIKEGRIVFPKNPDGRPREKKFLAELGKEFTGVSSVLPAEVGYTLNGTREVRDLLGENLFSFPKPVSLLKFLIQQAAKDDDIVLDFFAGSGTTGHATLEINKEDGGKRRFILVQLPEKTDPASEAAQSGYKTIADITRKRISKAIEKIKTEFEFSDSSLLGYKAYRLTSSNFKLWDASAGSKDADGLAKQLELYADNLLPGRSQDDILYEVILKAGQPLTAKIEKIEVAGQKVFSIDGGAMLICLEDPIKEETLVGMLEYQPAIMVALDKAFHGNDQLKTNIKLQAEATGESEQSRALFKTV
ncbi:MAG: site-specific DNA-methyltransferase [Alphaproteobacteria bacterium PRO2]|nr:site-specific DNA-methyltransferase [Alphaproteobacteria bacterium PRO2]